MLSSFFLERTTTCDASQELQLGAVSRSNYICIYTRNTFSNRILLSLFFVYFFIPIRQCVFADFCHKQLLVWFTIYFCQNIPQMTLPPLGACLF